MKNKTKSFLNAVGVAALIFTHQVCGAQQNGLNNTVSSPNIELGGDLIRHTDVSLFDNAGSNSYNLAFNNEGVFGVGNTMNAAGLYNYNGVISRSVFSYENINATTNASPFLNTLASYYKSNYTMNGVAGIVNRVDADCNLAGYGTSIKLFGDGPTMTGANIYVSSRNMAGSGVGAGIIARSGGARVNYGGSFSASSPQGINGGYAYGVHASATGEDENIGGNFLSDSGAVNYGVNSESRNTYKVTNSINIGIRGLADSYADPAAGADINMGLLGEADYAPTAIGVCGFLSGHLPNSSLLLGINAAIYGNANNAYSGFSTPYAGYFVGDVVIHGTQSASGGTNPSTPPSAPYALEVNGNAYTTAGTWYGSDKRYKTNIKPLTNTLEKMKKLTGYNYTFKTDEFKEKNFNSGNQIGFIAQELQEVFPELVKEGPDGYLAVNYQGMVPVLMEAIKEQQTQLDAQKQLIEEILSKQTNITDINELNNPLSGFTLDQNIPNPFSYETTIKYTLPTQVSNASIVIYDLTGKQITTMSLIKGSTSITVTSEKLSAGIYIYSIVADGKLIDSKKMIVAEK